MSRFTSFLAPCLALIVFTAAQAAVTQPDPSITAGAPIAPLHGGAQTDQVAWTQITSSIYPLGRDGTAVLGNYMYCFGSEAGNVAQALNISTEQWAPSTPPLLGWDNWPAVATNSAIYLIGRSASPAIGEEVQRFTPTGGGPTGIWTLMAHYPHAAYGVNGAWDGGNYIYASGGETGTSSLNSAYRYDIANNQWDAIANLPVAMVFAGAAFIGGKYHVMGGNDTGSAHFAYDPATNSWTVKAAVPTAIYFATSSVTQNQDYIFSVGGGGGYYIWPATDAVQIYDPISDTWTQETPLPVARGCNSACWVGSGKVISAGGWFNGWTSVSYRGTDFPGGTPHNVDMTMTPINPPIVIPPSGGNFSFNASLQNNESNPVAFDVWIMVQLPNQSWYGPVLGPLSLTLQGGATLIRLRAQSVPASAPAGNYVYRGYVGDYPAIWDSSGFTFTKSGSGNWGLEAGEWTNTGEDFAVTAGAPLRSVELAVSITPNPFNPSAVASFELRVASRVSLRVYDTSGRLVVTLADGWREAGVHEVTFDGSGLAAGIYLARLTANNNSQTQKLVLIK